MKPFFSIVLVNYNTGKYLEEAIQSVLGQDCNDYEFIVCDAGSTDNSLGILEKYKDKFAWWVSEPDKGQSDAFNKGFSHAKGEFYTWINADDLMLPGTLSAIKKNLESNSSCKWLAPNHIFIDKNNLIVRCYKISSKPLYVYKYASIGICPSSFFHRDLYCQVGGFSLENHFAMDMDMWMKFLNMGYKYKRLNYWGWAFRLHEESKTSSAITSQVPLSMKSEMQKIEMDNHLPSKKIALIVMRLLKCFYDYPMTYIYTLRYKKTNINAINQWL